MYEILLYFVIKMLGFLNCVLFHLCICYRTEENVMIDGQVNFLNSVIVDMQRKNEQLMARVQALEGGPLTNEPLML